MNDWVKHFAEEERQRRRVGAREAEAIAARNEDVRLHLQRLVESLRARVAHDVEEFAREFPDRGLVFDSNLLDGGFTVRREHYPETTLTVQPRPEAGTITVNYVIALQTGTHAPDATVMELAGHTLDTLHFRDDSGLHSFRTIAQLSEYLLVPVFAGRLR
jgi:hypothetical protein